jgi:hypothetical protein
LHLLPVEVLFLLLWRAVGALGLLLGELLRVWRNVLRA